MTNPSMDWLKTGTRFERSNSVRNARKEYFSEKCSFNDACRSISLWLDNNLYICFKGETQDNEVNIIIRRHRSANLGSVNIILSFIKTFK